MPYCPKCDMEFVDGITICSDCKGPLVASKEYALQLQKEEKRQMEEANQIFKQQLKSVYKELHADHETGAADNK